MLEAVAAVTSDEEYSSVRLRRLARNPKILFVSLYILTFSDS